MLRTLERRFGRYAIPGLLPIIAFLQALVFGVLLLKPELYELLAMNTAAVRSGEVWRILTFCLVSHQQSFIGIIFSVVILLYVGNALEGLWGSFRLNVYAFACWGCLILAAWLGDLSATGKLLKLLADGHDPRPYLHYFNLNMFLAYALMFPHTSINLYGIFPVPARWLGWLDLGYMAFGFYTNPPLRWAIGLSLIPFLCMALPLWYQAYWKRVRTSQGRSEFAAVPLPDEDHFHKCQHCGRTDVSHPELAFRVLADGTERCLEHLAMGS